MHYLFLGEDSLAKDQKISEIKNKLLPSPEEQKFDYQVLHGNKLNPEELKKALMDLPAVAKKRLVVVRTVHKLSPHNKKLVLDFLKKKENRIVLLLDADETDSRNSFMNKLESHVKIHCFSKGAQKNVFDMTRAMTARHPVEALKILGNLLADGNHPLQIMGGLVWFWGKSRPRMSPARFQKGLTFLQEADLNIKRSRLKPEYSLEVLVIKLEKTLNANF